MSAIGPDIAEPLRRRAGQCRRWLGVTAPAAALSLAYAWALQAPRAAADRGFRHIDVPRELSGVWQEQVSAVTPPPPMDLIALFNALSVLVFAAAAAAILAGIVKWRHPWALLAPVGIALAGLVFAAAAHFNNFDGFSHARLEDATPSRLAALEAAAALPRADTFGPLGDHFTGADLTRLDGLPSHSIEIKTMHGDGQGPGTLYVDGHPISDFGGVSTATVVTLAHYAAAQAAYLRLDSARTRRELEALSPRDLPLHTTAEWRVNVMREWVRTKSRPALMHGQDVPGSASLGLDLQRGIADGLALAAGLLIPLSLLLFALVLTLRQRLMRIDALRTRSLKAPILKTMAQ